MPDPETRPVPERFRATAGYPDDVEAKARRMCERCDEGEPRELRVQGDFYVHGLQEYPCAASYLFTGETRPPMDPEPCPNCGGKGWTTVPGCCGKPSPSGECLAHCAVPVERDCRACDGSGVFMGFGGFDD